MEYVAAALLGFAGGTLGGLVGVGGGIVFVPALAIFLDQSQVHAEATSLFAIVSLRRSAPGDSMATETSGCATGSSWALSPLGVAVGVLISNAVSERTLQLFFAALALVFAAQLLRRALTGQRRRRRPALEPVLERALDRGVEGVEPVERQRLGRGEAAPRRTAGATGGLGPVMGEHAMEQRQRGGRRAAARRRRAIISAPIARWPSSRPSSLTPNSAP